MSGKSTTTTGPSAAALPYLNQASSALNSGYQQSSALASQATGLLSSNLPGVTQTTLANPNLTAAGNYDQSVLSGQYLGAGNPYLNQQVANTNADVTNTVNCALGTRGLAGGSAAAQILSRELAKNETNLRYTDYTNERNNMAQAASGATGVASAQNQGIAALMAYLSGETALPQSVASNYASGINSLWGNSTTSTQKTSPGFGQILGAGLGAASLFA